MIIEFSVGNYRSFNSIQTINFRATSLTSANEEVDKNNIVDIDGNRLLKTIGVYGANGSGKSNLIKGVNAMKKIVASSLDEGAAKEYIEPFALGNTNEKEGGFFQVSFLLQFKKYRYGFLITREGQIASEWLFGPADKNETYYFKRYEGQIEVNGERFPEGLNLPLDKLRSDALFLSFCSGFNSKLSISIKRFFSRDILIDRSARPVLRSGRDHILTDDLVESGAKATVLNWMKEVGIHLNDIMIFKPDQKNFPNSVLFYRNRYDKAGNIIGTEAMDLDVHESDGTRKFYSYIGRLYRIFFEGGLFCSDEIDANFHPSLLRKLIQLFNNPRINKAGAQLLFTSHDTNLMDPDIMRRDQFYFTEKTNTEETRLYSLADLKGIRNNADFARQYLAGFYGALPPLSNYLENMQGEN